jgi:hypothetical protein
LRHHIVASLGSRVVLETVVILSVLVYKLSFAAPFPSIRNKKTPIPIPPSLPAMLFSSHLSCRLDSSFLNLCSNDLLNRTLLLNRLRRLSANIRVILHHTLQLVSSLLEQQLNIFTLQRIRGLEYA